MSRSLDNEDIEALREIKGDMERMEASELASRGEIPPGTKVLIRPYDSTDEGDGWDAIEGKEYIVLNFVPASEDDYGLATYFLSEDGGLSEVYAPPHALEVLALTAVKEASLPASRLISEEELRRLLGESFDNGSRAALSAVRDFTNLLLAKL